MRAVDADTIAFGSKRIRLNGIAAPESGNAVYLAGRHAIGRLIRRSTQIECILGRRQSHGRDIGRCVAVMPDGSRVDLQAEMVRQGFARACPGFGVWRYMLYENSASLMLPFPSYCWPG